MAPGALYVGGKFTDAGGIANADRIAKWNGSSWSAVSSSTEQITNGEVFAIAIAGGKVYAGGRSRTQAARRRQPRGLGRHDVGAVLHRARPT